MSIVVREKEKEFEIAWFDDCGNRIKHLLTLNDFNTKRDFTMIEWYDLDGFLHRIDGPANIVITHQKIVERWYCHGKQLDVQEWFKANNFPDWSEWTNREKILFKLRWA